jgi:hypothetical protein
MLSIMEEEVLVWHRQNTNMGLQPDDGHHHHHHHIYLFHRSSRQLPMDVELSQNNMKRNKHLIKTDLVKHI